MSQPFVPFATVTAPVSAPGVFVLLDAKPSAAAQTQTGAATLLPAKSEGCGRPTITLQRNGEIVSGIRVQCGCGEVVELTCVY